MYMYSIFQCDMVSRYQGHLNKNKILERLNANIFQKYPRQIVQIKEWKSHLNQSMWIKLLLVSLGYDSYNSTTFIVWHNVKGKKNHLSFPALWRDLGQRNQNSVTGVSQLNWGQRIDGMSQLPGGLLPLAK